MSNAETIYASSSVHPVRVLVTNYIFLFYQRVAEGL